MLETVVVLLMGFGLWGIYLALQIAPETLLFAGVWIGAAGFLVGLPAGALYHLLLYRSLGRIDALSARWWLHPTSLHDRIPESDRLRVLAWCYLGAGGFLVIVVGLGVTAAGALRLT